MRITRPPAASGRENGTPHHDAQIARVASRQAGAISGAQLGAIGLGRGAVAHRVATGRLHRRHRGVYLVGHTAAAPLAEEFAALLACGPSAILSRHTAAGLWGFRPPARAPVDVLVPGGDPRRHPGIRIRSTARPLPAADRGVRLGLPVTAPARTLLDLAAVLDTRDLRWAIEEARVRRLLRTADLRSVMERNPRRRGAARLRTALGIAGSTASVTRSEAERRLADLLIAARLPQPEFNVRVGRHEVDVLWRAANLVVEVDGYAFHSGREAFERDRRRDAELQVRGFQVTRLTWRQITEEPLFVAALLARLLARPPADRPSRPEPG